MTDRETAIIVGVGPGLGAALARRFAKAGMQVAVAARTPGKLETLAAELGEFGGVGKAYGCNATKDDEVDSMFAAVTSEFGPPDLVVYNASGRVRKSVLEIETEEFISAWRYACLGGFVVGRAAARSMVPREQGTILFTGASASVKGFAGSAGFAVGKFGLRGLSQSMARELQPKGIHVAHVVIDGGIWTDRRAPDPDQPDDHLLSPDDIAESYYALHRQPRSAWSQEIDVRPWVEKF